MDQPKANKSASPEGNSAIIPIHKLEEDFYDWEQRHDAKCFECECSNHDLVFIGDSLTHFFEGHPDYPGRGEDVWTQFYAPRSALNLGFGWDRTQNVLWRLGHGEFAGQTPRLVVILIGTNNLTGTDNARTNTSIEIVEGIQAVCRHIREASPSSHILLMGLFPRSEAGSPLRNEVREINNMLQSMYEDHQSIEFLDIGNRFLSDDDSISTDIMNDGVHLTKKGYQIWSEAIDPVIRKVFGAL